MPVFGAIPFGNEFHATLRSLEADPDAPGFSDVGLRNLVFTHVLNLRPEAVLEIGSHIGTASVVIGQALKLNGFGRLFTVEPQAHYQGKVEHYVRMAGVGEFVEVVKGFSHEGGVRDRLRSKGPFELIFVDANHDYVAVKEDIRFCWSVLANDGFLLFHDTSRSSQSLDSEGRGGCAQRSSRRRKRFPTSGWFRMSTRSG
ncbi:MAG: class I SAM-dependent methyltransferase [Candidatus Binatia bacterium]